MHVYDTLPPLKGHWAFDVFEGDPERMPLTPEQERENALYAALYPESPFPLHVGAIVSRPIDHFEGVNLITTSGKELILDRLFALGAQGAVTHMGVGNSATAAAVGQTQLLGATPVPFLKAFDALPTRSALVVSATTTFATTDTGADQNWQELGLFNGATNGTSKMLNRIAPIGPFNKTAAVAIGVTVTITQG